MFVYVLLFFLTVSFFLVEGQNNDDVAESKEKADEKEIHYVSAELLSSQINMQENSRRRAGKGGCACGKIGYNGESCCYFEMCGNTGDFVSQCCYRMNYMDSQNGLCRCCLLDPLRTTTRDIILTQRTNIDYTRTS